MPIRKWVQPLDSEGTVAKTSEPAAGPREILTFTVYFGLGLLVGAALFKDGIGAAGALTNSDGGVAAASRTGLTALGQNLAHDAAVNVS